MIPSQTCRKEARTLTSSPSYLLSSARRRYTSNTRRAIASSETEDGDSEQEISQVLNAAPVSLCENPPSTEASSAGPQDSRPAPVQPPPEKPGPTPSPVPKKTPAVSPLPARPSYICSLRKAGKRAAQPPGTPGRAAKSGPPGQLCDRAADFTEQLTSIFREASKPRNRSPDGESSPDSGYLCPKTQPTAPRSASQGPTEDRREAGLEAGLAQTYLDRDWHRPQALLDPVGHRPQARREEAGKPPPGPPGPSRAPPSDPPGGGWAPPPGPPGGGRTPPPGPPVGGWAPPPGPPDARRPPSAPRFIQKLRSQEVAEGSSLSGV